MHTLLYRTQMQNSEVIVNLQSATDIHKVLFIIIQFAYEV